MKSASSKAFWFPLWRLFGAIVVIAAITRALVESADNRVDRSGATVPVFTDVTARTHLGDSGWHSGCAVGDYNNDGFPDLYVTGLDPNKLYRNNGDGTFTEVGEPAGVRDPHWGFPKWSMGAAFGDYDNDGYLDLYVTNFVKLDPAHPAPRPSQPHACVMKGVPI